MKNILLVTPLYPVFNDNNSSTFVCHYFARDWIKLGYNVRVIHMQPDYPVLSHIILNRYYKMKGIHPSGGYYYSHKMNGTETYLQDDVKIFRIPIIRLFPSSPYSTKSLNNFVKEVYKNLDADEFIPEVIIGHMIDLRVVPLINERYGAKTCIVSHGIGDRITQKQSLERKSFISKYDIWGYRSVGIKLLEEKLVGKPDNTFICYSGIPQQYISSYNKHSYKGKLVNFLYVGEFIRRKYPEIIIESLCLCYPNKDFTLTYIGRGDTKHVIENAIALNGINRNVTFTGKISRDEVTEYYDSMDCMIMISRGEAFGLVYLEAMARGCIVIASRNEGIDGIVVDGINGFLCEAGNAHELAQIINKINLLSDKEKLQISNNAIETAHRFTDIKAAEMYINNLKTICND